MINTNDISHQFLQTRLAVAFLGESHQFGWWKTRFLEPAGIRFLGFVYPRSALAAAATSASEAAKKFHDSRIGTGKIFHLFRLPIGLEFKLRHHLLFEQETAPLELIASKEAALDSLRRVAGKSAPSRDGPLRLGGSTLISSPDTAGRLAALYHDAFSTGKQTLPYFTLDE